MKSAELREALLNREFTAAQSLITEWGQTILGAAHAARTTAERRRILNEARLECEHTLYLAQVVRAQISSELQSNSASFLYSDIDLALPRWRMSG